jgi:flavin reductase (DIM6/NTAB) family NADH-FMN oxidoreductase RutF
MPRPGGHAVLAFFENLFIRELLYMAKVVWKGGALLAPVPPVMVSCGTMEHPNIITVAWTGLISTHPPRLSVSIRPGRYSYGLIRVSREFVVNLTPAHLVYAADLCGMYTGAKVDKFQKAKLTPEPAQSVSCPIIAECPLSLECRVTDVLPQGTHDLFLADIVAADVDESILDKSGRLRLDKADLAAFAHGEYFELGKRIGRFGMSVAHKRTQKH